MATSFDKTATGVLDYKIDWATWLSSETISTSTWAVEAGITVDSDTNTTTTATVWLSGGTVGKTYSITNTVVTSASRTSSRTIEIVVGPRYE